MLPPERIWILTNDHLRAEIVQQLPEVPKRQILAEPAQRNTAPAIGLAAHILQSIDPNAVMGVFPVRSHDLEAGRLSALRPSRVQSRRRRQDRGAGNSAALAGDRLRLHRISRRTSSPVPRSRFQSASSARSPI